MFGGEDLVLKNTASISEIIDKKWIRMTAGADWILHSLFDPYKGVIPSKPGVYVISFIPPNWALNPDELAIDVYIGITNNLNERLNTYCRILENGGLPEKVDASPINIYLLRLMLEFPRTCFRVRWKLDSCPEAHEDFYINCNDIVKTGVDNSCLVNVNKRKGKNKAQMALRSYQFHRTIGYANWGRDLED